MFQTESEVHWIYKTHSNNCPNLIVHEVMAAIKNKFNSRDQMSHVGLRSALDKLNMKRNEYPVTLFEQLIMIKNSHNDRKTGKTVL